MSAYKTNISVRFINTFEPVVPLYDAVIPQLNAKGIKCTAMLSNGDYRGYKNSNEFWIDKYSEFVWVPKKFENNKRLCAIFYALLAPLKLLFKPANLNIILTQPPLFFIIGAFLSRITRTPYIIHVMDLYPDILVQTKVLNENGLICRVLNRLACNALRHAERIIVLGQCMQDTISRKGVELSKIWLLPNWASDSIKPVDKFNNLFRKKKSLENKFIIMYSGNMGIAHEFNTILNAARELSVYSEIVFVFIGKGERRKEIEAAINSGAKNISLMDYQPLELLPYSLGAADLHFMSLRQGFEGLIVPSKLYGILAAGRPIIYEGSEYGEVARVLHEFQCGKNVKPGSTRELVHSILYYYNDREALLKDGERAWNTYHSRFSYEVGSTTYIYRLFSVVSECFDN